MIFKKSFFIGIIISLHACAYKSESVVSLPHRSEIGMASYYGNPEKESSRNAKTASGEILDPMSLTAAHKTLPFGSYVKVENLSNQKSVVVKVNDRGPFVDGRIVDLSYGAATKIDMLKAGKTKVRLTYVEPITTSN